MPLLLISTIEAGWPSPAEEELHDTMTLDAWLITHPDATFGIKVNGNSMNDAGIFEGDLLLVERGKEPKDGDIIVASVDGNMTIKRLRKREKEFALMPANKNYQPIIPREGQEIEIKAVVICVIRKIY